MYVELLVTLAINLIAWAPGHRTVNILGLVLMAGSTLHYGIRLYYRWKHAYKCAWCEQPVDVHNFFCPTCHLPYPDGKVPENETWFSILRKGFKK